MYCAARVRESEQGARRAAREMRADLVLRTRDDLFVAADSVLYVVREHTFV